MVDPRRLQITGLERIARFRAAGYGGNVSDALASLGVRDTVFSSQFTPLRQGMQLVGRALPVKPRSPAERQLTPEEHDARGRRWEVEG